jgi:hypothetical protein
MEQNRIVEINGVKVEVDLRSARVVESYRVGDPVKVLVKNYSGYKVFPGVIVSFDEFKNLPTINVIYLDATYSKADLLFAALNAETKDVEIAPASKLDITLEKATVLDLLYREAEKKRMEILEIESKRDYFLANFQKHFAPEAVARG